MANREKEESIKIGFIGGGRITGIILEGWKRARTMPENVVVSDINSDSLSALKEKFPKTEITGNSLVPATADVVILALHPPLLGEVLGQIKGSVKENAVIVSLAPKWKISAISDILDGNNPVVRIIPNAPSVACCGFNPAAFPPGISEGQRKQVKDLFSSLGSMVDTEEEKLEAYAILTAMGPTYFWFQWYELAKLSESFGLSSEEALSGLSGMIKGALEVMTRTGLTPAEVMDLIPVRPVGEGEENIKNLYDEKLNALFKNLTG